MDDALRAAPFLYAPDQAGNVTELVLITAKDGGGNWERFVAMTTRLVVGPRVGCLSHARQRASPVDAAAHHLDTAWVNVAGWGWEILVGRSMLEQTMWKEM
ncbi:unnamed protein product [Arctogadus glacialis]